MVLQTTFPTDSADDPIVAHIGQRLRVLVTPDLAVTGEIDERRGELVGARRSTVAEVRAAVHAFDWVAVVEALREETPLARALDAIHDVGDVAFYRLADGRGVYQYVAMVFDGCSAVSYVMPPESTPSQWIRRWTDVDVFELPSNEDLDLAEAPF